MYRYYVQNYPDCLSNFFVGKMVESKKALPKEPRLSYYNGYSNYYHGSGPMSPPGARNYYGNTGFQGGYVNGNRYYQHHQQFQVSFNRKHFCQAV